MRTFSFLLLLLLATVINRVNANADAASNICSQACVRLVVPKENMTKEEEERFNVASNNGYKCAAKCHDLFVTGDSEANVITKLQKISFDDIYLKQSNVQATVALDEQIKQLTKRIEQLEKFVVRLGAIARIHTEEQNRPGYRPLWRKNRQNKDNEKTTVATAGASTTKKVVASSNQEGGPQIQHSPVVGGPQLIDSPPGPQILPIFNPRPALANANLKKIV